MIVKNVWSKHKTTQCLVYIIMKTAVRAVLCNKLFIKQIDNNNVTIKPLKLESIIYKR